MTGLKWLLTHRKFNIMDMDLPFKQWQDLFNAPRSAFYTGHTRDTVYDRATNAQLSPSTEAMFTQSNARVLIGQSANGSLRMVAIPTQVYPAPTSNGEFGLGPGMYHHFDVAMYLGDIHYKIALEGETEIDLAADQRDNTTWYADHYLPVTRAEENGLEIHLTSLAPVAPEADKAALAPAPLPGPAGVLYLLHVRNTGSEARWGKIILEAGDQLIGHLEDGAPERMELNRPEVSLRQHTLILSRPFGAVGIHFHAAKWVKTSAPFQAEQSFTLQPGEEAVFETHVAIGAAYADIMPVIFGLHLHPALEWFNLTAAFWRSRLGQLTVRAEGAEEQAQIIQETYLRALFDNFNCLQTDANGILLAHWQGAPSHGYGTVWGIDVEPTAVSIVHLVPELTRQTMIFFMTRSRVPIGPRDHSVPILVAPVILAYQWLQVTGDTAVLDRHPEIMDTLQGIMDELLTMKSPDADLFPSRFSSDGPVGRRYDFGTNAKASYAFDSMAYLMRETGQNEAAGPYEKIALGIRTAIQDHMLVYGPFGPQISGGTNLGEDPQGFYLPEDIWYYDGEDTSSMLAPIYGVCAYDWEPWVNYHRFARSLWCPEFDPEFGALNWFPREPGVMDGTGFFSRLGGSVTPAEMKEAIEIMRASVIDEVTGSVFWWPHGVEYKRSLTRCSQGQGAWAWQYVEQWLGLMVDRSTRTLTVAPRGLLTSFKWQGFRSGENQFDLSWAETNTGSSLRITNHNSQPWVIRAGFRAPGSGAAESLNWQSCTIEPGQDCSLRATVSPAAPQSMTDAEIVQLETAAFSQDPEVLFKRYGPAMLWGHWDTSKSWIYPELPNALRFVIANNTIEDWQNLEVSLHCPEGWSAMARQPMHWPYPDGLQDGEVCLSLGSLPGKARTVAPFWVGAPGGHGLLAPSSKGSISQHLPSQPKDGVVLADPAIGQPVTVQFTAELSAATASGEIIHRQIVIPVQILPAENL